MLGKGDGGHSACNVIEVTLDGQGLEVPPQALESFGSMRSYLELLALRQGRVLSALSVDGQPLNGRPAGTAVTDVRQVQACTISFRELSEQWISAACAQVLALQARVEAAAMQVLINDWPAVAKLWHEWAPEFLSPLLITKSLRELCGGRIDELMIEGKTLQQHLSEFQPLWKRLETVFAGEDIFELSNALEHSLEPWLEQLAQYLARLRET